MITFQDVGSGQSRATRVVVDGAMDERSDVSRVGLDHSANLREAAVVQRLLSLPLAEIGRSLDWVSLPLYPAPHSYLQQAALGFTGRANPGSPNSLQFFFHVQPWSWTGPWSIAALADELTQLVAHTPVPGPQVIHPYASGFFTVEVHCPFTLAATDDTALAQLDFWVPKVIALIDDAHRALAQATRKDALVSFFNFPSGVGTACQQYLLYFVQFLQDLGISARAELREDAHRVLFSVIPESGPEALGRIREALAVYLALPGSPDFSATVGTNPDIAVQQLAANVRHLESQLMLQAAVLEAKNATIEVLRLSNYMSRQLLTDGSARPPGVPEPGRLDREEVFGGTAAVTDLEGKGFVVRLPEIMRRLKRRFGGHDGG